MRRGRDGRLSAFEGSSCGVVGNKVKLLRGISDFLSLALGVSASIVVRVGPAEVPSCRVSSAVPSCDPPLRSGPVVNVSSATTGVPGVPGWGTLVALLGVFGSQNCCSSSSLSLSLSPASVICSDSKALRYNCVMVVSPFLLGWMPSRDIKFSPSKCL